MYFEFYCDPPCAFAKAGWKDAIDSLMVRGFGAKDVEIWNADKLLVMKLEDEFLAAATIDLFDFEIDDNGKRLWIESLTIPDHPLKQSVSLFSMFWDFIWESIEDGADSHRIKHKVSLLIEEDGKEKHRLIGIYSSKGMKIEQTVRIGGKSYLVMIHP